MTTENLVGLFSVRGKAHKCLLWLFHNRFVRQRDHFIECGLLSFHILPVKQSSNASSSFVMGFDLGADETGVTVGIDNQRAS